MAVSQAFLASCGNGPSSAPWGAIVRMAVSQAFLASFGSGPSEAQKVVEWMNERDGLDRLCRRFPERVQQCYDVAGERLPR